MRWLCALLFLCVLALVVKIILDRRALDQIREVIRVKLAQDTNTLISVPSNDPAIRRLADALNAQLRLLRDERRRLENGDLELKEAVTNISHDLRTPLTAICGYLELLEQEEKSENAARYLRVIAGRVEALKQLTEELFRYSVLASSQEEEREPLALNAVLEESLAAAYEAFRRQGVTPLVSLPDQRVERTLSRPALARIFGNIISNALKYGDGDFRVVLEESGRMVFSNTARRLSPVMVGRLFDRFFTVETGRNATGLGLSIAKLLTERQGGAIAAEYRDETLFITVTFEKTASAASVL